MTTILPAHRWIALQCLAQANPDVQRFQRIINLVTKYDTESVLIDIFRYLTVKMEFGNQLAYEVNCNDNTGTPTDDFLSRKSRIYQNLFLNYLYTDSLASLITSSATVPFILLGVAVSLPH